VDWWTLAGGGVILTGGVYTLSGAAGQPEAGERRGGIFTVTGGFFAVETPHYLHLPLIFRE
jgi:hypothetical protein